ncbi:MAG: chain length determinant protein EpsF, partial [Rubrivivax sp.]
GVTAMSVAQFFVILRARWWVCLIVLVLCVVTTVGISRMMPKQFEASATVVVDVKPDPISTLSGVATTSVFIATQVDVIKSERVALRVVRNLKLTENPQIREEWMQATQGAGSFENWLAGNYRRELDVKPSRESNIITVSYTAQDPRFAAGMANAFVQAYLDTALELRVSPARQYAAFFDVRSKEAREALEAAQAKLSNFQRNNQLVANDERLDIETTRLNELSSQLVSMQAVSSDSSSRQAQASGSSAEKMQEVLNNPVINALKADISRTDARLQEVSSRLGDNHPQVIELRASLSELRRKLDSETRRVTGGVTVSADINRRRESELRASLEAQRSKVLRLKAVRDEAAVLQRDVENAQRALDAVTQRLTQTNIESQTTNSNVYMLAQASAPAAATGPKVVRNAFIATLAGTLLGILACLLWESLDKRVRTMEDAVGLVGLPVLAVMPRPVRRFRSRTMQLPSWLVKPALPMRRRKEAV